MKTLWALITRYFFSEDLPLDVRTVNVTVFVGILWTFAIFLMRVAEFFLLGEISPWFVFAYFVTLVLFIVVHAIFFVTNAKASTRAVFILVIVNTNWPLAFFLSGGLSSGFPATLVMTMALIFFMAEGRKFLLFLILHGVVIILTLASGYYFNDWVVRYSDFHAMVDTTAVVLISGCTIGVVDLFQRRFYQQEHQKAEQKQRQVTRVANELVLARNDLLDQERLLSVVNQTTQMFLSPAARDLDVMLIEALGQIGETLGLDRICIWRAEAVGKRRKYRVHDCWVKGGAGCRLDAHGNEHAAYLQHWEKRLLRGETINGPVASLPADARKGLADVDIKSLLVVPVFQQDEYWGFASFDDCRNERVFPDKLVDILRSASFMLVSTILLDEMNQQMHAALNDALEASKAKSDFLSNMSHEIRTPMNAIIGMTLIARSTDDVARKDISLDRIDSASRHLLGIINDILDMSKLEANKLDLSLTSFDLGEVFSRILMLNELSIKNKELTCVVDVDKRIPAHLIGDDMRLFQVVTNLLSNAIKFTPKGGRVTLTAELIDDGKNKDDKNQLTVRISVGDSGIGISPEQQQKLFVAFQQADSGTSRKYGGTGLGLSISRSIVELMKGRIWVESELGKGSTFIFEIPLQRDTNDGGGVDRGAGAEEREKLPPLEDFAGSEVLLAEDIEVNREIMAAFLEDTGVNITMAANGREALELFEADPSRYGLILMDMQMPEMDGLEATRRIRALKLPEARKVPIVAMTANVFKEDVEHCLACGMNAHIGKPITVDDLKRTFAKYLKP
jgi:signal transduction histidine kinase/ActR/RegA family two-component response regulator